MAENHFEPERHHRHQFRLKEYDYTSTGAYFVTICTKDKQLFFENESIKKIVKKCWEEIPQHSPNVELDQFVVMPNHLHGIIIIIERRDAIYRVPTTTTTKNIFGPLRAGSLSVIVGAFKAACTRLRGKADTMNTLFETKKRWIAFDNISSKILFVGSKMKKIQIEIHQHDDCSEVIYRVPTIASQ